MAPRQGFFVIALPLVLALAACSPAEGSVMGLSADSSGAPVAVVAVCDGHIDGISVFSGADRTAGSWFSREPFNRLASLPLADPPRYWRVLHPLEDLQANVTYTLEGWTEGGSWRAASLAFTLKDLSGLKPGEVLYTVVNYNDADESVTENKMIVQGAIEFTEVACAEGR